MLKHPTKHLTRGADQEPEPRYDPEEMEAHAPPGKHRLFEGRTQHDEADLNSEKIRLVRDVERHDHVDDDEVSTRSMRATAKRKS